MGAGASSVEYEGNYAENAAKVVQEASDQVDNGTSALENLNVDVQLDNLITDIGGAVSEGSQDGVKSLFESVRGLMSAEQLTRATEDIKSALPNLEGDAIFAGIAGSLQAAAEMSGPVVEGLGAAVLVLGAHLPFIAVAAGAIGAIVYAFRMSKDYDENVKNVTLWMASVKDWLMLVAAKISSSGAASTLPLFEGLQDAMLAINAQMDEWTSRWRITKMLSSATFDRDFSRVKTAVLELKTALRDYLDEETQQRQESQLGDISALQLETQEKLNSMDEQLVMIRTMLTAQEEARVKQEEEAKAKKEADSTTEVNDEAERIFQNIQRAAGVEGSTPVDFRSFVLTCEVFFFNGCDMPSEQRRGLAIAVDRDQTKVVTKAAWIKFYRQWTEAEVEIESFLVKIAEDNPTALKATTAHAKALVGKGLQAATKTLAAARIDSTGAAKKKMAEGFNRIGGKFGVGKKSDPPQESAPQ